MNDSMQYESRGWELASVLSRARVSIIESRSTCSIHNTMSSTPSLSHQLPSALLPASQYYTPKLTSHKGVVEILGQLGVPEDRRPKAGRKLVTGVQNPADRKRKREIKRALGKSLVEKGNTKRMEEMQDKGGEEDAESEEDAEGEDNEEYYNDDDEEGEPKRNRQRFS